MMFIPEEWKAHIAAVSIGCSVAEAEELYRTGVLDDTWMSVAAEALRRSAADVTWPVPYEQLELF